MCVQTLSVLQLMQANPNKPKKQNKEAVNISRNKKSDLAKEFQEFKQRIQQFEDKNQEIINRIRQTYSFKKKNMETRNINSQVPPPQVYQRNRPYNDNQSDNSSCDLSQKIVYDGNVINHSGKHRKYQPQFYNEQQYNTNYRHWEEQNMQLLKFQKPVYSGEQLSKGVMNHRQYVRNISGAHKAMTDYDQMQQIEPQYRNYEVKQQTGKFFNEETIQQLQNRLQEVLSKNSILESEIQAKDEEINRVRSSEPKLKSYMTNAKKIVAESLQNFQQDIIVPRLDEVERYLKKCINRMKNLALKVKDQLEERQAHRTIQRSKSRRRLSSKHKEPNSSASSVDMKESSVSGLRDPPRPSASRALSNQKIQNKSEITSKQKQFQQIASEYEKMIKSKVHEIEELENKLKQEVSEKEKMSNQIKKYNKLLQEKTQQLKNANANASTAKKPTREDQVQAKESKELKEKMQGLQQVLRQKEERQKQLVGSIQKIEKSKKVLFDQQKESYNKTLNKKNEVIHQLEQKLKKIESDYFKQMNELKQKLFVGEKYILEKDVEIMGLGNKLKKVEADLLLKDEKLKELQKLILKQNDQTDLLQKSMSIDNSLISPSDLRNMQESLRKLQEQIEQKINIIYELQRQKHRQSIEIQNYWQANEKMSKNVELLQKKIKQMNKQSQSRLMQMSEKQSARQLQQKEMLFQEYQEEQKELIEEKQQLLSKNKSLLEDLKKLKDQNLGYNREIIKLNSQIAFNKDEYQTLKQKYAKSKEQIAEGKSKISQLQASLQQRQNQYIYEIKSLQEQVKNLTNQIIEFESLNKTGEDRDQDNLLNSLHASDISFNNKRYPEQEINALKDKAKELETQLQMKELIQLQMQNEYKSNLQKIRADSAEKNKELQNYINDIDQLKKQLKKAQQQKRDDMSFENYKISLYQEKIVQLQTQYNTSRQSEERLNELLHSLMQNIKDKSEEMNRLTEQLQSKDKALQELKQLMDLKTVIKDKGREQNKELILRISGQGSEEISDIAEISYMSNISDVFKRDDVLQQKMRKGKTSRQEFVKLFTKTSAYIKTLKQLIQNKDKRIKTLEKQIQSLKTQDNKSWNGSKQKERVIMHFSKTEYFQSKEDDSLQQYKDYESMQLDTRRTRSYEQIKELQREKELAVQENKMLLHQIDALQEEIAKAEQQENSLVKIKDLYKEEIKKLMEKNQAHNKEFEIQINKMKQQLQSSLNFHNWEALKQLLNKVVGCFAALQDSSQKAKRQQRKKQMEEYLKVMSCILGLQITQKQRGSNSGKK